MGYKKRLLAFCLIVAFLFTSSGCAMGAADPGEESTSTPASLAFTDVPADADFAPAVAWCLEQGLMNGTGETTFSPDTTLTRAMVATVLYRTAGKPAVSGAPAFEDTEANTWYSNAVTWANQNGIVRGYGNGLFGTEDPITQEQLDILIRRYKGENPTWTGDPTLNAPATRAQAAVAFYENLNTTDDDETVDFGRILVAYFSRAGENYSVGVIEKGNTAIVAETIAEQTGGDLFEIVPVNPYPVGYEEMKAVSTQEKDSGARPEIANTVDNWDDYDVVFLGYPIWYADMPMIVYNFLESYDFTGKTVIPFNTN